MEKIDKKVKIFLKEMTKEGYPKTILAPKIQIVCAEFQIVVEEKKIVVEQFQIVVREIKI